MPIWVWRMTEGWGQKRGTQSVHRLCTMRAPFLCIALAFGAGPLQAGSGWDLFLERCLHPFEQQMAPVIADLHAQPIDQMHDARRVYGPSDKGHLLIVESAPRDGGRACLVEVTQNETSAAETMWRSAQVSNARYRQDGDWLVSTGWISPRVMMRSEATDVRTIYEVHETGPALEKEETL